MGDRRVIVHDSFESVALKLADSPWYSIGFTPIPDHSAPLMLDNIVVGYGWVPPCAKYDFLDLEGQAIATLEIWLGKPRVTSFVNGRATEAIANAFTRSFS